MQSKKEASRQREEVKVCLRQCTTCRYPGNQAEECRQWQLVPLVRLPYRVSQVWHALMSANACNCSDAISFSSVRCQLSAICCLLPRQSISLHCPSVRLSALLSVPCPSVSPSIPWYTSVLAISWSPPLLDCLPHLPALVALADLLS